MSIRDKFKEEAQRLNGKLVLLADNLEKEFENVPVFIDTVTENDVNDVQIIETDKDGNLIFTTESDFIILESGNFTPNITGKKAMEETTILTFVSQNRPDILLDILTIMECFKLSLYSIDNVSKDINPLDKQDRQMTVVVVTATRLSKVGC